MDGQPIWTHSWCLINLSCLFLVNKATFDHPPANGALETSQGKQAKQNVPEMRSDIPSGHEVGHGYEEDDPDGATNDSVEPFPEEYVLESVQVHALMLVDLQPLRAFLVLCELFLPLFIADRRQDSMGFPPDHRKATLGQPGVSADPDDGEDGGAYDGEPRTYKFLFSSSDKLFTLDVKDDWSVLCLLHWLSADRCECLIVAAKQSTSFVSILT